MQLDECTGWAAAKCKSFTLSLVYSARCWPDLTHVGNIPLQLLRCISDEVAGPQVSLVTIVYSLTDISMKESETLAFGRWFAFKVLFS